MKLLLSIIIFTISYMSIAQANNQIQNLNKFICSLYHGILLKDKISSLPKNDKYKHCAMSCSLALRCNPKEVYRFGILKEIADLLGMGAPEQADIEANKIGIRFVTGGLARDDHDCLFRCDTIEW